MPPDGSAVAAASVPGAHAWVSSKECVTKLFKAHEQLPAEMRDEELGMRLQQCLQAVLVLESMPVAAPAGAAKSASAGLPASSKDEL